MKLATVSVDLDNLWCYQRSFGKANWQNYESFLHIAIPRLLRFLQERDITCTFFVVGKDAIAPRVQVLLREIVKQGHEVANHSFNHDENFHHASQEQILGELKLAHNAIKESTGQTPVGFRGPAFGLSNQLIQSLVALNYLYDASTFPNSLGALARRYQRRRTNFSNAQQYISNEKFGQLTNAWSKLRPHFVSSATQPLVEIPVTTSPLLRLPCHGTYLHFAADKSPRLALAFFKSVVLSYRTFSIEPSFLLHASDFLGSNDDINLSFLPGMQRTHSEKMVFMHRVFDILQQEHKLIGLADFSRQFKKEAK